MEKFLKENRLFLIILVFGLALHIAYALTSASILFNDNGFNAWIASHFFDKTNPPEFLSLRTNLEFFTVFLLFRTFGQSSFVYNLLAIFQFGLILVIFYAFLKKFFSKNLALVACFLLAFSPPIFTLNAQLWTGHERAVLFNLLILFLFYLGLFGKSRQTLFFSLAGISAGLGMATSQLIPVLMVVSCLITWFFKDHLFFLSKNFLFFIILAFASFLFFNNFEIFQYTHFYQTFSGKTGYNFGILPFFKKIGSIFYHNYFIFGGRETYFTKTGTQIPYLAGGFARMYGAIFFLSAALWLYLKRKILKKFSPSLIFPTFLFVFYLSLAFSRMSEQISRYYLSLLPLWAFFISDLFLDLKESKNLLFRKFVYIAFFLFVFLISFDNFSLHPSGFADIKKVIDFAKGNKIYYIYTDYHHQWALIFHSQEEIKASSQVAFPMYRGTKFDEEVEEAENIAYLYREGSCLEKTLLEKNIKYQKKNFGELVLFYNLDPQFKPSTPEVEHP